MQKSKIEWTDYSWNPIKGICPVGCWYCYARRMYQRFRWAQEPWLDIAELNQVAEMRVTGKRIFVCSTFELFHPAIDSITGRCVRIDEMGRKESRDKARDMIFDVIKRRPDLTFIILTKMPERIDRPMPENVWLGVSITQDSEYARKAYLMEAQAAVRFISHEPMLGELNPAILYGLEWAILGRLTGHGKNHDPDRETIEGFVENSRGLNVPIFLKDNLREIWGEPLIQEWPNKTGNRSNLSGKGADR